jgi:hypothetical protein
MGFHEIRDSGDSVGQAFAWPFSYRAFAWPFSSGGSRFCYRVVSPQRPVTGCYHEEKAT